MVQF